MFEWYRSLIAIRKAHPSVTLGNSVYTKTDDMEGIIVETREYGDDKLTLVFHGKDGKVYLEELAGKNNLLMGKVFDGYVKGYEALVLQ